MAITVEQFYDLLIQEIQEHTELQGYYRFLNEPKKQLWRKAYFCQRLEYIAQQVKGHHYIWDIGCGYGTTGIFLALNGYKVHGSTLEYYFAHIPKRMEFWSKVGDISGFTYDYADLYDSQFTDAFDGIIVQDTIHHTEPVEKALQIMHKALKPGGRIIAVEENGKNLIQRFKLYLQRGNKRIIELHDEKLNKTILLGNENIRSLSQWNQLFENGNFEIEKESVHYVRVLPNALFGTDFQKAIDREQKMWRSNSLLRDYFFFGLSFCAKRK